MNSIQQARWALGCVFGLIALMYLGVSLYRPSYEPSANTEDEQPEVSAPPRPADSPRLQEIDKQTWTNPEQAAQICREILKSNADTDEKTGAAKRLPKCLRQLFDKRRQQKAYAECQSIHDEMFKLCFDTSEYRSVANDWRNLRMEWLREMLEKDDLSGAAKLLTELRTDPAIDKYTLSQTIYDFVRKAWKQAADLGDYAKADAVFKDFMPTDASDPMSDRLADEWLQYKSQRWKAARDAGQKDEARAHLLDVAPLAGRRLLAVSEITYKLPGQLTRPFTEEFTGEELAARADAFAAQRSFLPALTCYGFALRMASSKVTWDPKTGVPTTTTTSDPASVQKQQELRGSIGACARELARDIAAGKVSGLGYEQAKTIYSDLVFSNRRRRLKQKDDAWLSAATELQQLQASRVETLLKAGRLSDAEQELKTIISLLGSALWGYDLEQPGFDGWAQTPAEIKEEIERANPNATPAARLAEVTTYINRGEFVIPRLQALAPLKRELDAKLLEQSALQALAKLDTDRESAFRKLRPLLRDRRNSEAGRRVVSGLQSAIKSAQAKSDFAALNDLCGFYVAEAGAPDARDPFREELRGALQAAADEFARRSPITRVFLLSLLADALPDDPAGQAARQEAMDKGLEVMRATASQKMQRPARVLPSTVSGCSVLCIENLTPHHLMLFLDGPERCFARINPLRKGVVVIKDGKYMAAVIVTADEITPFRAETTYKAETQFARYFIRRSGRNNEAEFDETKLGHASGDYQLLRSPPEMKLRVDPKTGLAAPAR